MRLRAYWPIPGRTREFEEQVETTYCNAILDRYSSVEVAEVMYKDWLACGSPHHEHDFWFTMRLAFNAAAKKLTREEKKSMPTFKFEAE